MGYVGNQSTNAYSSLPAKQDLTGATGTSLTLSHAVAGPESIDLFINNVRQEPTTAYSVSDTTVTLTGSVVATDDIYVVYNGLALQTIVPPDGSVSTAKIADDAVTSAKIADNAVTTAKMDNNDRMVDVWYISADVDSLASSSATLGITGTFLQQTTAPHGFVGTSRMSLHATNGRFTFPKTGIYKIYLQVVLAGDGNDGSIQASIDATTNDTNFTQAASATHNHAESGDNITANVQYIFSCTNTTTHKIKFFARSATGNDLKGGVDPMRTFVIFERIADV